MPCWVPALTLSPELNSGLVVASHGRHVLVETSDGRRLICHPRGKKNTALVGDRIQWQATGDGGSIEKIEARRNLLYRQDEIRSKSFAANLDQVLILVAAEPEFSESQLARALIAAEAAHIAPLIGLNKSDLSEPFAHASLKLEPYRSMGYEVIPLALKPGIAGTESSLDGLKDKLQNKVTLVLGPSGAGKSTLINLLIPGAQALTGEISTALNTGRHTTTSTLWYWLDDSHHSALIDSPGFQEFGLHHIEPVQLPALMPDIQTHTGNCRFYNCTHLHEPGCGVRAAVELGHISPRRYEFYGELLQELSQANRY
ncbi:MAG: ribosome small subunit-dependent GTPase A [Hylemonella sp.]